LAASSSLKALAPSALDEALTWLGVEVRPARVREAIARQQTAIARSAVAKPKR
jgi:hypothetical protein